MTNTKGIAKKWRSQRNYHRSINTTTKRISRKLNKNTTKLYKKVDKGPYNIMAEGKEIDGFEVGFKQNKLEIKIVY